MAAKKEKKSKVKTDEVMLAFGCAEKAIEILDKVMQEHDFGHVKYADIQEVRKQIGVARESLAAAAKKQSEHAPLAGSGRDLDPGAGDDSSEGDYTQCDKCGGTAHPTQEKEIDGKKFNICAECVEKEVDNGSSDE